MLQVARLLAFTLCWQRPPGRLLDDDEVVFRSDVAISIKPNLRHIRSRTHLVVVLRQAAPDECLVGNLR